MALSDINFATSYNKAEHDIANEFYLPCMRSAEQYDRISGYFGSTIYIIAWDALKEFINNSGKMRLICSPYISEADEAALSEGYNARSSQLLADSIIKEFEAMVESPDLSAPSKLLAYLVVEGIIDVKIAIPTGSEAPAVKRLFHDKVGIFSDGQGNKVGFRGSMNETFKGLAEDGNIESIDVFPNWLDQRDKERVEEADTFFNKLWRHRISGIQIYEFPSAAKEIMRARTEGVKWEELLEEIKVSKSRALKWKPGKDPEARTPRKHQVNALETWEKNGCRGIFEHATGSGKTFTAMCAINDALKKNETVLILVPSRDLLKQWNKELRETLTELEIYYLLCGDSNTEWKKPGKLAAWSGKGEASHRIIIATMDTASSNEFIKKLSQGSHLMLVADEVHRMGSPKRRNILNIETGARLGLSATPRRYGDPVGTAALFEYFDGLIPPPFTLEDAIKSGVLTRYFYFPQRISLTDGEQQRWDEISDEIRKLMARTGNAPDGTVNIDSNPRLKQLLINRSRIVKNASGKVSLAIKVLKEKFQSGQKWIVYCDNIAQLNAVCSKARAEGFDAYEYYADMEGDRDMTLDYFSQNGGVLVSIKCLDEGVDIPSTTDALILASSQNPREFIQRRGRILRNSAGKLFAHLYDAITVPVVSENENEKGLSIISAELSRAIQFGENAENPACVTDLKNIAVDYQIEYSTIKDGGIEDDDEE
ncbi:type III restriction endonuclease subunit R [Mogibacterium pumilum]|uniref:Type III restriction endonuclease subunit R n=1 Tax=Mogibacterium pumilum TaxID=86332 RepID=A0A223AR58_9FIRM|nr:DEAD/DEAH box helicase family protein [Mogibacterium pumilum]ASS37453.1 type III restriction endonuclease subunit R [Mogibacterium pumilum]